MTQTSTHSYDCTGFRSICCYCGCWDWSLHLSDDGFFPVWLLKVGAKWQLLKEALTPWKPDASLKGNAALFQKNWLFIIVRLCLLSRPSSWRNLGAANRRKSESIKNIKQPPRLQRASTHRCPQWVHTHKPLASVNKIPRGLNLLWQPCSVEDSESSPAIVPGVKPSRHTPEMRTIKLSYETTNSP